jgi:hypothetical protein
MPPVAESKAVIAIARIQEWAKNHAEGNSHCLLSKPLDILLEAQLRCFIARGMGWPSEVSGCKIGRERAGAPKSTS